MLPSRFWKRDGGTLDASHSLLIRLSRGGDPCEDAIFMLSGPARSPSLSPAKGSLSEERWEANGSWLCREGLPVGVPSMPSIQVQLVSRY